MTRGDNNVSKSWKNGQTGWSGRGRLHQSERQVDIGILKHMAGFLWDKELKGRRRRRQVMRERETRTGATHVDGRDGGNEEMSKPRRAHGLCRAGSTRGQEGKGTSR